MINILSILLSITLLLVSCSNQQVAKLSSENQHFYDLAGNNLEVYDRHYNVLYDFYGKYVPKKILVNYRNGSNSRFHTKDNSISISTKHLQSNPIKTAIHESSHISLSQMTDRASVMEQFRFFDEGMANIMGSISEGNFDIYREKAINTAYKQLKMKNLSFAKVQDWTNYYGNWKAKSKFKSKPHAYPVGSSFVYFIWDNYGKDKLKEFFVTVGRVKDLETAINNVFQINIVKFEKKWIKYIKNKNILATCSPSIAKMIPSESSKNVSTNIQEITVVFDRVMDMRRIVFRTDCKYGICYTNAYWKGPKTLAVKVPSGLRANHTFRISLGHPKSGHLQSAIGCPLPITKWSFTTQ